jgi:hypothetical protein
MVHLFKGDMQCLNMLVTDFSDKLFRPISQGNSQMLTKTQKLILAIWIGGPFIIVLLFTLINPNYERYLFLKIDGQYGINFLILIQVLNSVILYAGFRRANYISHRPEGDPNPATIFIVVVSTLTCFFCTLPSFFIAIVYPSMVVLMEQNTR